MKTASLLLAMAFIACKETGEIVPSIIDLARITRFEEIINLGVDNIISLIISANWDNGRVRVFTTLAYSL